MTDIEEIPINTDENQEILEDIQETNKEITEENTNIEETQLAPKKKGRPLGARNKSKEAPKPKAKEAPKSKVKAKAKKEVIEYESEYESEEEDPPPKRRRAPMEVDRNALAADVLSILQQQKYDRSAQKRALYASWFENM